MYSIRRQVVAALVLVALILISWRSVAALKDLVDGDETAFLAFPLEVILPSSALGFLALRREFMISAEGALMKLGAMMQIVLILALPGFALHLALGFPVVFLVVELFETRLPARLRDPVKRIVLA